MINKKFLALTSIITTLSTSSAFARTQGNYIGIDAVGTESVAQYKYANGDDPDPEFKNSAIGVGLNYKYAFNVKNFFFAPGIFAEMNNINEKRSRKTSSFDIDEKFSINDRYGLKADIGYDITNNFALYATGGVSRIDYKYKGSLTDLVETKTYKISDSKIGYFYGAGLKLALSKNVALNLEYNAQSVDLEQKPDSLGLVKEGDKITSDLQIVKLGVSYNF